MKIYNEVVISIETNKVIKETSFEYGGALSLCGGGGGSSSGKVDYPRYMKDWHNIALNNYVQDGAWGTGPIFSVTQAMNLGFFSQPYANEGTASGAVGIWAKEATARTIKALHNFAEMTWYFMAGWWWVIVDPTYTLDLWFDVDDIYFHSADMEWKRVVAGDDNRGAFWGPGGPDVDPPIPEVDCPKYYHLYNVINSFFSGPKQLVTSFNTYKTAIITTAPNEIRTMITALQGLSNPVTQYSVGAAHTVTTPTWTDRIPATFDNAEIDDAVDAFAEDLARSYDRDMLPRFQAGMRDINAVQSSAFTIGSALILENMSGQVDKFASGLRVELEGNQRLRLFELQLTEETNKNNSIMTAEQLKMENFYNDHKLKMQSLYTYAELFMKFELSQQELLGKLGTTLANVIIEANRIACAGESEIELQQLDVNERYGRWPLEMFSYGGNFLGSISGSAIPTNSKGSGSGVGSALGGAMSGAAMGGMVGGPVGAVVGGVAGAASSMI